MTDVPELALLWALKTLHPSEGVRRTTGSAIDAWIASLPTADLRPGLREAVRAEQGTLLEPFIVKESDIAETADLGAIALAQGYALRIVSRDKLAPNGGLLLTMAGTQGGVEATYSQRLATAALQEPAGPEIRFVPGSTPAAGDLEAGRVALWARSSVDEEGHVIQVGPLRPATPFPNWYPDCEIPGQSPLPKGSWWGRVFGSPSDQTIALRPRGPEVAIQVTALMLQRRWIVTRDVVGGSKGPLVAIRLAAPSGADPTELQVIGELNGAAAGRLQDWLQAPGLPLASVFSGDLKQEVGTWIGLPAEWMQAQLLEGYP
jgi:hypothetical protein